MFIRATRLFVWVRSFRYSTSRFLRGVADDHEPKQSPAPADDAAFFDVGFTLVS